MEATETAPLISKRLTDMASTARIWVYKSARNLSSAEQKLVREQGDSFTSAWAAHGAPLDATVDVLYDRFVVIAVDEEQAKASGCSLDKSVGFIKDLEYTLNMMLTDRMVVVFEQEGVIRSCRLQELPELIAEGVITGDTIVYDDQVSTLGDLRENFRVQLRTNWMARFM
ncbi:MAG: hypothetical protein KA408_06575 [Flavobacteriales bacterium]|nr:hypothetical protein [Flavobacteriales bacterium]